MYRESAARDLSEAFGSVLDKMDGHVQAVNNALKSFRQLLEQFDEHREKSIDSSPDSSSGQLQPIAPASFQSIDSSFDLYCVCHEPSHGTMIACDNENCRVGWFHLACVGLRKAPKGSWRCPACRDAREVHFSA